MKPDNLHTDTDSTNNLNSLMPLMLLRAQTSMQHAQGQEDQHFLHNNLQCGFSLLSPHNMQRQEANSSAASSASSSVPREAGPARIDLSEESDAGAQEQEQENRSPGLQATQRSLDNTQGTGNAANPGGIGVSDGLRRGTGGDHGKHRSEQEKNRALDRHASRGPGAFRIQAKQFAITFPQCPVSRAVFDPLFNLKFQPTQLATAREKHQDGSFHLHVFVRFNKCRDVRSARYFDVDVDGVTYHPNVQKCKSAADWTKYLSKGDDHTDFTTREWEWISTGQDRTQDDDGSFNPRT